MGRRLVSHDLAREGCGGAVLLQVNRGREGCNSGQGGVGALLHREDGGTDEAGGGGGRSVAGRRRRDVRFRLRKTARLLHTPLTHDALEMKSRSHFPLLSM